MEGFAYRDDRRKWAALVRGRVIAHPLAYDAKSARAEFGRSLGRGGLVWRRLGSVVKEV